MKKALRSTILITLALSLLFTLVSCDNKKDPNDNINAPFDLEYLNANMLTKGNRRQNKVPAGWTGIYTLGDLDAIRNNAAGAKYILMNDIIVTDADCAPGGICEGGWKPIPMGIVSRFNGNGYVIKNLKISHSTDSGYIGLFESSGTILNLGIEGCEITVDGIKSDYGEIRVGAITGNAHFVGGCYATGVTINVKIPLPTSETKDDYKNNSRGYTTILIGGVSGNAKYIDSCYSDAEINIDYPNGGDGTPLEAAEVISILKVNAGGVVGRTFSCVSSFYNGNINAEHLGTEEVEESVVGDIYGIPTIIEERAMLLLLERVAQAIGENNFRYKKLNAFYGTKNIEWAINTYARIQLVFDVMERSKSYYYTADMSNVTSWRLLDPAASTNDYNNVYSICEEYLGRDALMQFFLENNIKCGTLFCYTFEDGKIPGKDDLPAFDFENIWTISDGEVRLRIFET